MLDIRSLAVWPFLSRFTLVAAKEHGVYEALYDQEPVARLRHRKGQDAVRKFAQKAYHIGALKGYELGIEEGKRRVTEEQGHGN